ncbi:MAG TPA: ABC transporter permease [bacterium]|nr:ABC transporter permease [bacterium]HPN43819.1 ABC transporter permease [bacterium]
MFTLYFKSAFRNLRRYKSVTIINFTGLVAAFTACLVILLYIREELSFDADYNNAELVYRVGVHITARDETTDFAVAHIPLAPAIQTGLPGIEYAARFCGAPPQVVRLQDGKSFYEKDNYYYADPALLDIFNLAFLHGSADSVLNQPEAVLISASLAKKYFGSVKATGHILSFDNRDWIITGVFADIPHNSHLPEFQFITRYQPPDWAAGWDGLRVPTYIKLEKNADPQQTENQINRLAATAAGDIPQSLQESRSYFLQRLQDIHLHSAYIQDYARLGDNRNISIFSGLAFIILLLAALNYINLTTARSLLRHKEIGIHRVIGAHNKQIVMQFLSESFILTLVAFGAALLFTTLLAPVLGSLTGMTLSLHHFSKLSFILPVCGLILLVSLLSGFYPACLAITQNPASVFRGGTHLRAGRDVPRKILVILQFTAASALLIITLVTWQQLHYMRGKDLGFDKQQMLVLPMQDQEMMAAASRQLSAIKQEFTSHPGIASVTAILRTPGRIEHHDDITWNNGEQIITRGMNNIFVDFDFMDAYSIQLVAGREFDETVTGDAGGAFIINESAARAFGWRTPQDALGKQLSYWMGSGSIIGVCKDFHLWSLHRPIEPLFFLVPPQFFPEVVCVKITAADPAEPMRYIKEKWLSLFPGYPFDYYFLDEDFNRQYRADELFNRTVLIFTGFVFLIAIIGLFGLVSILVSQRTKEIGIRKVLGASTTGITLFLNREYLLITGSAALISWPLAYLASGQWLQQFAFRIHFPWIDLITTTLLLLLIAMVTISGKTIQAANTNPVNALRYE